MLSGGVGSAAMELAAANRMSVGCCVGWGCGEVKSMYQVRCGMVGGKHSRWTKTICLDDGPIFTSSVYELIMSILNLPHVSGDGVAPQIGQKTVSALAPGFLES